ncbi:peptide chain release factor N(5)-glutamine methyltransferase [Hoeflea sp. G2-23]|uniref:Release factor glutamine methyltransferase n=1 Tax=Hoeflea algicola TaxID=2983763 RepID=A0ABT3ZA28_9HYPH|nr:peptide chain release factor N(5)-glutamine methyltransferase [Hoeflea algicola]MCY0148650.1 peptide chain release factor N(5)-glutamine methyltransferase [Hoeflea algicola]
MARLDLSGATTLRDGWLEMRAAFRAAGLESADLDARLLSSSLAGIEPHHLTTEAQSVLDESLRERLAEAGNARLQGKPVHRILGMRDFYGLPFLLSAATLEPRPDTETLVIAALPHVHATLERKGTCSIVDLGIGTGAVGLALLAECPQANGLGVDVSAEAVATALGNADRLGLSARYRAAVGDWLSGIEDRFDLVVSNPPYIPTADLAGLSLEVTGHDPLLALDGGDDGLDAYRVLASQVGARLMPGGQVAMEIGIGQGSSVTGLFCAAGFELSGKFADLGGVERALLFHLPEARAGADKNN